MGGYNSGRKASEKPSIDDLYALDVCQLYRDGVLNDDRSIVIRFRDGYVVRIQCRYDYWGWKQCLEIKYPIHLDNHQLGTGSQVIGIEWRPVLNGRSQRPYFLCPSLEILASKLFLGDLGFTHRKTHDCLYRTQRLGHFDRAVRACRRIQSKLGCVDGNAASDEPSKPKGMHQTVFKGHCMNHKKAANIILQHL